MIIFVSILVSVMLGVFVWALVKYPAFRQGTVRFFRGFWAGVVWFFPRLWIAIKWVANKLWVAVVWVFTTIGNIITYFMTHPKTAACLGIFVACSIVFFGLLWYMDEHRVDDTWKTFFLILPVFGAIGGIVHVAKN
jgi:hypothetical protein